MMNNYSPVSCRVLPASASLLILFILATAVFSQAGSAVTKSGVGRAASQAFTIGDLVIYRVGTGTSSLSGAAAAVFLDEYTTDGTFVRSITMPTEVVGQAHRLVASGSSQYEGYLTRTANGRYLIVPGYDGPLGSAVIAMDATAVNRVIGKVDGDGNVDTTSGFGDVASNASISSAASIDGNSFWITGTKGGLRWSGSAPLSNVVSTSINNIQSVAIFDGQLYVGSISGTIRMGTVGDGTPTSSGEIVTSLPGITTDITSPYGFYFADLSSQVPGMDTLYIANDQTIANGGGVLKFCLIDGVWTASGRSPFVGLRGLTAGVSNDGVVSLYATSASGLYSVTDTTGYNGVLSGAPTLLATAAVNTNFRGIAFAPVSPSAADVTVTGRLVTSQGAAVGQATVILTSSSGTIQSAISNPFGYFSFPSLTAGETYVININARRAAFRPRTLSVEDNISDLLMIADE